MMNRARGRMKRRDNTCSAAVTTIHDRGARAKHTGSVGHNQNVKRAALWRARGNRDGAIGEGGSQRGEKRIPFGFVPGRGMAQSSYGNVKTMR